MDLPKFLPNRFSCGLIFNLVDHNGRVNPWHLFIGMGKTIMEFLKKCLICFRFICGVVLPNMKMLNNINPGWYVNWVHLSNVAKVSFRISILQQHRTLWNVDNISRKQGCKIMANRTVLGRNMDLWWWSSQMGSFVFMISIIDSSEGKVLER